MSAWHYLKAGFWQRVPLPLVGRVPLNAAALAGFAIAGLDNPVLWVAGAGWQTLWLAATAGRAGYRQNVREARRRELWRPVEERRLQLYNQLPPSCQALHHQVLTASRHAAVPAAVKDLFAWLHLKLLLAREALAAGTPRPADPDLPRLHAIAAVELTDPVTIRLADEIIALLDPRQGLKDATRPLAVQVAETLSRTAGLLSGTPPAPSPPAAAAIPADRGWTSPSRSSPDVIIQRENENGI